MQFAVIGNPIAHSLSPEIHLAFALETGNEISYERILADPEDFDATAQRFFSAQGAGLNVTAPFKGNAYTFVDERDAAAEASGAVNTIHAAGSRYLGYNTDGIGLVADLTRLDWPLQDAKVLLIGAGGAAQGVVLPLLEHGAKLCVANRTKARAEALKTKFPRIDVLGLDELTPGWDVVINATAAGWQQQQLPIPDTTFQAARCYDLGYQRDGQTPFIQQVHTSALEVSDGLGMLVEQAAEAFRIWHDVRPQSQPVLEGIRKPKRQFIAGAACPRCGKQDTIYVEQDLLGNAKLRGCHTCSYREDVEGNVSVDLRK